MVSTFANPVARSTARPSNPVFNTVEPVELWPSDSSDKVDVVIRAVYRQVLGNAHVMESERLVVPESQLRHGEINVREFVRQVAKSELYRSLFVTSCYRYRTIELNFKHLLGRAPQSFEELKAHSAILDTEGYEADIDSYIDSDEYETAFGENVVPFHRGYSTVPGQTMVEFTNMLQLFKGASSSDKHVTDNRPRVANTILSRMNKGAGASDAQDIIRNALRNAVPADSKPSSKPAPTPTASASEQDALIEKLQQQLANLRSSASIGEAILRKGQRGEASPVGSLSSSRSATDKSAMIERLQGELMEARALAAIGNARLNKWRRR